ncbi:MAG: hypothetical protein GSR85_04015 [Desulfurococcales archaeon]|nr:hypothetical protein [Desulfurococcales archaeon]
MAVDRLGDNKRVIVILDANTLIYMAEGLMPPSLIDSVLDTGYRMVTLGEVVGELRRLRDKRGKTGKLASKALELMERLEINIISPISDASADDAIEAKALELKRRGYRVIVATSDRELRRRLKRHGIPTLYYRESRGAPELEWLPI